MSFSVVIPAHNEEGSIGKAVRSLEGNLRGEYEILVVDDHSTDATAGIVKRLNQEDRNVRLIQNNGSPGFASTLKAGFSNARFEFVVPVMADLCDDPSTINKMYEKALQGYDIVCGSRYMRAGEKVGGPLLKTFFSRFVSLSLYYLIGIPTHDIANAFKMYRKRVLEKMRIKSTGFEISVEIPLGAYFLGYRITEVPTVWVDRKYGKSKFSVFNQGPGYLRLYLWAIGRKLCSR